MKVLVTGGCGFIGSNLANSLHDKGWDVDVVDDLSNGHLRFLNADIQGKNLHVSDFSSDQSLEKVKSGLYEYVFHLAANPRVSYSVENPYLTNETNVTKTLKLLDACREGKVRRVIFASSSSVYGASDIFPTSESQKKDPKSPYALQKSIIEEYLRLYSDLYGLDSVCLRFFNVFGPNQLGGSPYSTAVSSWLTSIKKGISMRSDGDGTQTRDMCYVDNVVDACIRAAECIGTLGAETFNVACGTRTSNKEILELLKSKYPYAEHYDAPWRLGDVMHTQADLTNIGDVLGYKPIVDFKEGLDRTVAWYEENWHAIKEKC